MSTANSNWAAASGVNSISQTLSLLMSAAIDTYIGTYITSGRVTRISCKV